MRKILLLCVLFHAQAYALSRLIVDGTLTVTINEPGHYLVAQDVNFAPVSTNTGIFITVSNVVLDLMGYAIAQTNGTAQVTGIAVSSNLTNIIIKGGTLSNFSNTGITVGSGCEQILIDGITCTGCGQRGIDLAGTAAAPLRSAFIKNCNFFYNSTLSTADNVLTLSNVRDSFVDNCVISTCGSTVITGTCAMIHMSTCRRTKISNTMINNTIGQFDLRGIRIIGSFNNMFTNVVINEMLATGGGSVARGFHLENTTSSTANIFQACIAESITATSTVDGFLSDTGCNDNLFQACISANHLARDVNSACHGFRAINNNRTRFYTCSALTCSSLSTVATPFFGTYGFKIDTTTATTCKDCIASDNTAATAGRGVGFFIFATTNCTMFDCQALRNTIGFDASNLTVANFNLQGFTQNKGLRNLSANYNTNANAWPANAFTNSASNSDLRVLTIPYDNVGIP